MKRSRFDVLPSEMAVFKEKISNSLKTLSNDGRRIKVPLVDEVELLSNHKKQKYQQQHEHETTTKLPIEKTTEQIKKQKPNEETTSCTEATTLWMGKRYKRKHK